MFLFSSHSFYCTNVWHVKKCSAYSLISSNMILGYIQVVTIVMLKNRIKICRKSLELTDNGREKCEIKVINTNPKKITNKNIGRNIFLISANKIKKLTI